MEEEKEITAEDVKKQFDEISNKGEVETAEESSTEETETSASATEAVKSVTEEAQETEEVEPKVIPYERFKEVNTKYKELEELAEQAKEFIVKDPVTGKLSLKQISDTPKEEKQEDSFKLSEEEMLALDSVQINVINKLLDKRIAERERQSEQLRHHNTETQQWWDKSRDEYPELKGQNFKESALYKKAVQILKDQYVVWSPDKKSFYIPPRAQYLSVLQAEKELSKDKAKTSQAKLEEKKLNKQQVFVENKSGTAQPKKKVDEKEFEELDSQSQEDALRAQFEESSKVLDE